MHAEKGKLARIAAKLSTQKWGHGESCALCPHACIIE